ncbi:MAG TPA: glycoside hydrolase family 3 N-terminal domain-containing protein [Longimicrobiaceae bacterium]|nr:glycoside hydrolase family 3 N-terminal domain-containing protein [Longimicrobiaceae bacterium]
MFRSRHPAALLGAAAVAVLAACAPGTQAASAPLSRAAAGPLPGSGPADTAWVERTLAGLTLRQKVAQLVIPWVGGEYAATDSPEFERVARWVEEDGIGGVVISIGLPHSYAAKLNELQRRARVPLLVTTDMETGPGMRLAGVYSLPHLLPQGGGTVVPPAMALGAAGSDSLAYEAGRVLAGEARAVGVHVTFGPVLDVNSNAANPIINTRSFGEDPERVARLGSALLRGVRSGGVLTVAKHFPGHGDTEADSHIELPTIAADRARLDTVELVPFRAAVEAGLDGMMIAHIAVTGVEGSDAPPASVSKHFVTGVLKEEMGFGGLVFTDAMDMGGVTRRYGRTEPLVLALEAGADVLLQPLDAREAIDSVTAAVRSGRLPEARIDHSVRRVLHAKARLGLAERRLVDLEAVDERVGTRSHRAVAEQIARRSITLARDERGLVPLPAGARRVLSVTYAEVADLVAGRAFDRELAAAGVQVSAARVDDRSLPAEFEALRRRADSADVVVASAYVSPREHRGTVGAAGGFPAWVEALSAAGKPVVAVTFGSPYLVSAYPSVPAYLLGWGGAEVSQRAAARALLGRAPITGTLPISIPPSLPRGTGIRREVRE